MIKLTSEQLKKIELIDTFFDSLSYEELEDLVKSQATVSKLRGDLGCPGILTGILKEAEAISMNSMNTMVEVAALKNDFQTLLKVLNMTVFGYTGDLQNLRQKYGTY